MTRDHNERRLMVIASTSKTDHKDRDDALWESLIERVHGVLADPQFACIMPLTQPDLSDADRTT